MTITLSESEQEALLEFSIQLAKDAGAVILQGSKSIRQELGSGIDSKKNSVDLVTEWDVKVEEIVQDAVRAKYPNFGFIGEESSSKGLRPELTDDPTFCVDPIDGTTNFVHGFPFACISIGVIYQRRPLIGVIFNPFLDQMAGIVLAQESGGFVSGGAHVNHDGDVTEEILYGRKYIVVRTIADTPGESGKEAQKRIVKEFYDTVEDWDPK
ncbi:hypothetical protein FRC04_004488 [Tulasnella sp. 424]|nr:hypothetical protein FRC04_004488 [Tulasnella sp. 424]